MVGPHVTLPKSLFSLSRQSERPDEERVSHSRERTNGGGTPPDVGARTSRSGSQASIILRQRCRQDSSSDDEIQAQRPHSPLERNLDVRTSVSGPILPPAFVGRK